MPEGPLPDGTRWRLAPSVGPGGQRAGVPPTAVVLSTDHGPELWLVSGICTQHRIKQAVLTCRHWSEVPLAIEAVRWIEPPQGVSLRGTSYRLGEAFIGDSS